MTLFCGMLEFIHHCRRNLDLAFEELCLSLAARVPCILICDRLHKLTHSPHFIKIEILTQPESLFPANSGGNFDRAFGCEDTRVPTIASSNSAI